MLGIHIVRITIKNKNFVRGTLLPLTLPARPPGGGGSLNPEFPATLAQLSQLLRMSGAFVTVDNVNHAIHHVTRVITDWSGGFSPGHDNVKRERLHNVKQGKMWQVSLRRRGGLKTALFLDLIIFPYPWFQSHLSQLTMPAIWQCDKVTQWTQGKHPRK